MTQSIVCPTFVLIALSKEAQHVFPSPPPSPLNSPPQLTQIVPLEQLWSLIPPGQRQAVLRQLTQMLAQQLARPARREAADD